MRKFYHSKFFFFLKVGRILDAIDRSGRRDDFMVVMVSDHGGRGTRHGDNLQENLNVPMIFRGPGITRREIRTTVMTQDLAPTIAGALGLQPNPSWVGRDLWRVLSKQYRASPPRDGSGNGGGTNNFNPPAPPPRPSDGKPTTKRPVFRARTTRPPFLRTG